MTKKKTKDWGWFKDPEDPGVELSENFQGLHLEAYLYTKNIFHWVVTFYGTVMVKGEATSMNEAKCMAQLEAHRFRAIRNLSTSDLPSIDDEVYEFIIESTRRDSKFPERLHKLLTK
jgi:hypothetical protein